MRSPLQRLARATGPSGRVWILLPLLIVLAIYAWIGSAGRFGAWPVYMTYYDLLAEGFRSGHLYIPIAPAKALLAQSNPYDPSHSSMWMWDASLYKDHYYMYWGPVPALLQASVKSLLQIQGLIGDQYLVFAGFALAATVGALLVDRIARRLFDTVPGWLRAVMVAAFALANPAPHLIASGGVYQASIGFGQAFALLGLLLGFDAVVRAPQPRIDWRLPLAGFSWALAFGSRISMLPTTALLASFTILACAWPARSRIRALLANGALVATPMLIGLALLLLYNRLRFDDWLEFGTNNQLSGFKFRLSKSYWLTNLYSYTLRPYFPDCHFPFAMAPWYPGSRAFPDDVTLPPGYLINEPVVGWLRIVPLAWLLSLVPFAFFRRLKMLRSRNSNPVDEFASPTSKPRTFVWLVACLGVLASVAGMATMGLYMATMRYLSDVTNGLVLLGILGVFSLYSWIRVRPTRLLVGLACCVPAAVTMVYGLLLGYQGYTGHFKTHSPRLNTEIVSALSLCDDTPGTR